MGNDASKSPFNANTTAAEVVKGVDLNGKVVIVTGANTGIGKETARVLATKGAKVILACRNVEKGNQAIEEFKAPPTATTDSKSEENTDDTDGTTDIDCTCLALDLSSLASIRSFVDQFEQLNLDLHCLINNAGIMALPNFQTTTDGIEKQFGVNHLGHFYLTTLLLPKLEASQPARVVNLSSRAHSDTGMTWQFNIANLPPKQEQYDAWRNYGCSKLCNILFTKELNRRYSSKGVTSYALHPGVIKTELSRNNSTAQSFLKVAFFGTKTIPQGAATTVYCAVTPDITEGGYFIDCNEAESNDDANNESFQKLLWQLSERLTSKHPANDRLLGEEIEVTDIGLDNAKSEADSSGPQLVPAEKWVKDWDEHFCVMCSREFTQVWRRHHCRFCGQLVCASCSRNNFAVPNENNKTERICDGCFLKNSAQYESYVANIVKGTFPSGVSYDTESNANNNGSNHEKEMDVGTPDVSVLEENENENENEQDTQQHDDNDNEQQTSESNNDNHHDNDDDDDDNEATEDVEL